MNRTFGGVTGTPSLARSCAVVVASLIAGASVVHNIYNPDLRILPAADVDEHKQEEEKKM